MTKDGYGAVVGTDAFAFELASPNITYAKQLVEGIGYSAPDSIYRINPTLANFGAGSTDSVHVKLVIPSGTTWGSSVTLLQDKIEFGAFEPGEARSGSQIGAGAYLEFKSPPSVVDQIRFSVEMEAETVASSPATHKTTKTNVDVRRPGPSPGSLLTYTTSEAGPTIEWALGGAEPSDVWGYYVYRKEEGQSDAFYQLLNVGQPRSIRLFVDESAGRAKSYVYAVSTVDLSGNESPRSVAPTVTSWLSVMPGWPQHMSGRGSSSAMRALDFVLNAEDDMEIFAVGDMVHCWKPDGSPCFANIGVPSGAPPEPPGLPTGTAFYVAPDTTYFKDYGRFWSSMVIGDLDGTANGLDYEIVLTSFQGVVYALTYDASGDSLKCLWQRNISGGSPTGAVENGASLIDVNGDGRLEVVVHNERGSAGGEVFVWDYTGAAVAPDQMLSCAVAIAAGNLTGIVTYCRCYDTGVGYSWFVPIGTSPICNGKPLILLAPSDGKLRAISPVSPPGNDLVWTYQSGQGAVLSTPVIGDVSAGGSTTDLVFAVHHTVSGAFADSVIVLSADGCGFQKLHGWKLPNETFNCAAEPGGISPPLSEDTAGAPTSLPTTSPGSCSRESASWEPP
jgi:hypothetical protein